MNAKTQIDVPEIDYLSKDYNSFRRLLLDQMALRLPDWQERNPSDLSVAVVELLAYAADQLSYYQDAVATEAYLQTSRRDSSVRRHARLLDYRVHHGCNSRVWVHLSVNKALRIPKRLQLVTRSRDRSDSQMLSRSSTAYFDAIDNGQVFETMHAAQLDPLCNELHIVSKNDQLTAGATSAVLEMNLDPGLHFRQGFLLVQKKLLKPGDVLLFEEVRHPKTGRESQADPRRRHIVRLTKVRYVSPFFNFLPFAKVRMAVEWSVADALPFDLVTTKFGPGADQPASVARGNLVLADSGRTHSLELLPRVVPGQRFRPMLRHPEITYCVPYRHAMAMKESATRTLEQDPNKALAAIELWQNLGSTRYPWQVRSELLSSGNQSRDFVVETVADGKSSLRFGFDGVGVLPSSADEFEAIYRTGKGADGNVGAEAIGMWIEDPARSFDETGITRVYNPLPACGGVESESLAKVRTMAPQSFRRSLRCVTAEDYAAWASRHPDVAEARAIMERTGRGPLVVIHVRRVNDKEIDQELEFELLQLIEPARQVGHDVSIRPPCFVRPRIEIQIRVAADRFRAEVLKEVQATLGLEQSTRQSTPSQLAPVVAFFASQQLGFGRSIYRSRLIAQLMTIRGVEQVTIPCFCRRGQPAPGGELIELGTNEVLLVRQHSANPDVVLELGGGK